ncbi:protein OSB2, chloroplastic-like isoform X2 [Abrus precatorius]|uniref:Protein OSB2, chloroplastic-like isoform X2 n=1 Tax=Abrus precatorius TaxID=3816 RepID=A0A8B8MFT4_ABRPR|nr:protein OSB2, chloroplastic-like isoform X2 [Abrus precatorius]
MALEHALSSTTQSLRNLFTIPQNPNLKPQFQFGFPHWKTQQRWKGKGKLKCSMSTAAVAYPKPSEIPWKKELCNSVNLIGIVAVPVEIKHFPSGKVAAWTRLAVKKNATQTSWIHVTFWDDLAHVASQHLQKGHQIYVSGRLVTDTVESDEGKHQIYYKVVAQQLNFIDQSFSPVSSHDQEFDLGMAGTGKKVSYAANNTGSVVELWQAFFANPGEWWDNRKKKRNPKAPDFKHKDTGEALWIEGRSNPPWVKSQLEILDMRMGALAGQNARMPVDMVTADEILSF